MFLRQLLISTYLGFSAAMLSRRRAVVPLLPVAFSEGVTTSVAPPSEGAAPLATAARFVAGCSGAFRSLTASYSSRICIQQNAAHEKLHCVPTSWHMALTRLDLPYTSTWLPDCSRSKAAQKLVTLWQQSWVRRHVVRTLRHRFQFSSHSFQQTNRSFA